MKYLRLLIECLQPIKVTTALKDLGATASLDYIPGSLIRGAFISNYIKENKGINIAENEKTVRWFFNNGIEFLNGYIVNTMERTLPTPLGLYINPNDVSNFQNNRRVDVKTKLFDNIDEDDKKVAADSYIIEDEFSGNKIVYVDMIENLHISNGENRTMFRYEAIKEGQTFCSFIKCNCSEKEVQEIKDIFNKGKFYLGGSKGSGYGAVNITIKDEEDVPEYVFYNEEEEENKEFTLISTSNGIYLNKFGEQIGHIDEEYLKKELKLEDVKLKKVITDTVVVGGYNNKWRCRLPQYAANKAGSQFLYSYKGKLLESNVRALVDKGIGLRTEEGYGRIILLNEMKLFDIEKAEKNRRKIKDKYEFSPKEENQIKNIVNSISRLRIEDIDISFTGSINNNQIEKLINLFENAKYLDKEEGIKSIKDYIWNLKNKKDGKERNNEESRIKLEKLKIGEKDAIDFINEKIRKLEAKENFYYENNLDGFSIGGIKPEFSEEEIYKNEMAKMEKLFKVIAKRKEGK